MTASLEQAPTQRVAVWDLVSNEHSRESCWANRKLLRHWGTRPRKLATLLGRDTCKRAAQLSLAQWPTMRNLHPTAWSCRVSSALGPWQRIKDEPLDIHLAVPFVWGKEAEEDHLLLYPRKGR